jgi:hypothetical protein
MPNMKCPKCQGEMESGLIPDAGYSVVRWRPGPTPKGFLNRIKAVKTPGYQLAAYRCKKCGFLEMYGVLPNS